MNDLNSVLIEGKIVSISNFSVKPGGKTIAIDSTRYRKDGPGEYRKDVSRFSIIVDEEWADTTLVKELKINDTIRIVGRLTSYDITSTKIYAEHLELRPVKKTA